ncbi:MAG: hypothetical protein V4503_03365 [Gemmatimonadota bacterium]
MTLLYRATLVTGTLALAACASSSSTAGSMPAPASSNMSMSAPSPDPRVGLRPGTMVRWTKDSTKMVIGQPAAEASWNMRLLSNTPPSDQFVGATNSDLAFKGNLAIQGSYSGYQIWDISNLTKPTLKTAYFCPASQSDVSVYGNLLFVSGEGLTGRIDCGAQGVPDSVSKIRLRGIRIFDITDINNPKNVGNVQTCRGSHTHTVLVDPKDKENVYVYISGSSSVRSPSELPGCSRLAPSEDPNSALFRIEVIKVPLAHPEQAAIVASPRIFNDLAAPPTHGEGAADAAARAAALAAAKKSGAFTATIGGNEMVLPANFTRPMLDSIVKARGGSGGPTGADSAALRAALPDMIATMTGAPRGRGGARPAPTGPNQCHDITVYPAIGLAGGACGGYGLLLDISDPANPKRIDAAADSNFSYWHSATFNNEGTKILFSDEWGGGGQPKCRATDKMEWGADAIFTLNNRKMQMQSYYKMPAAQTTLENCVAHNGSLIPIPGRDVMVQAWYQGGLSVFDWTDANHPKEIAFFDRGPIDGTRQGNAGSWSVYWYNGAMVSSEIGRGLDILELQPSAFLSRNEIDAAKSVKLDYLNAQGQPKFVWPASFSLTRAYLDQLERSGGMAADKIAAARAGLSSAEKSSGSARKSALNALATEMHTAAASASDSKKAHTMAGSINALADATQ